MTKMMTIKEVAQITGMSQYAIRQGIRQGKLPAFQLNGSRGKYMINYDVLQDVLKDLCIQNIPRESKIDTTGSIVSINTKIRRIQE